MRRRSSAFARGRSRYRGVSGQPGRWEARIGVFQGRKNVRGGRVRVCVGRGGGAGKAAAPRRSMSFKLMSFKPLQPAHPPAHPPTHPPTPPHPPHPPHPPTPPAQVSFGLFPTEQEAAAQYDRALVVERGRAAKTNFPLRRYEGEVQLYEAWLLRT